MNKQDVILSALYLEVRRYLEPNDHPTLSSKIAKEMSIPLQELLYICQELKEEGLLAISYLNEPPLLYLTKAGLSRVKRLLK